MDKTGIDIKTDIHALQKLKNKVKQAKEELSFSFNAQVLIENLSNGINFNETLTR